MFLRRKKTRRGASLKLDCHCPPFLCISLKERRSLGALGSPMASPGRGAPLGPSPEIQLRGRLTLYFQPHGGRLGGALRGAGSRLLAPLDVVPPMQLPHGAQVLSGSGGAHPQSTPKFSPRGFPVCRLRTENFRAALSRELSITRPTEGRC